MLFFILLSIILLFFCLYFYFENKKLKQKIIELELDTKVILERKLINNKEDLISIEKISSELPKETKKDFAIPTIKNEEELPSNTIKTTNSKKYTARSKEVEYKIPQIPDPITSILDKNTPTDNDIATNKPTNNHNQRSITNISISQNFDPTEFIKKEIIEEQNNNDYLQEIVNQIKEELIPQTIDLTDYEQAQEEQAVISYQELLSLKEKNNNDSKTNANFLESLKELRKLLD